MLPERESVHHAMGRRVPSTLSVRILPTHVRLYLAALRPAERLLCGFAHPEQEVGGHEDRWTGLVQGKALPSDPVEGRAKREVYKLILSLKRSWIFIFQYPVVAVATAIATDVTEALGVYCQYESKAYFAKLWVREPKNESEASTDLSRPRLASSAISP